MVIHRNTVGDALGLVIEVIESNTGPTVDNKPIQEQTIAILAKLELRLSDNMLTKEEQELFDSLNEEWELATSLEVELEENDEEDEFADAVVEEDEVVEEEEEEDEISLRENYNPYNEINKYL